MKNNFNLKRIIMRNLLKEQDLWVPLSDAHQEEHSGVARRKCTINYEFIIC